VAQFKYLGTTVTDQSLIHEEIKRRLNSGNAYYLSVQNLLSFLLLSENVKITSRTQPRIAVPVLFFIIPRCGPRRQQPVSRCMSNHCRGNVFTYPLPRTFGDLRFNNAIGNTFPTNGLSMYPLPGNERLVHSRSLPSSVRLSHLLYPWKRKH
jgi:hypothetical protein